MKRYSYMHKKYDQTIMQTQTVSNIVEALQNGIKHRNLKQVVEFLIEKREKSLHKADKRKANSTDKNIAKLKELGIIMKLEDNDGI